MLSNMNLFFLFFTLAASAQRRGRYLESCHDYAPSCKFANNFRGPRPDGLANVKPGLNSLPAQAQKTRRTINCQTYTPLIIKPQGLAPRKVMCKFVRTETMVIGYTIIQYRFDGKINFNRNWASYKAGFGDFGVGEYWLGFDYILAIQRTNMAETSRQELIVEFDRFNRKSYSLSYDNFKLGNANAKYNLHSLGNCYDPNNAGNSFLGQDMENEGFGRDLSQTNHLNMKFSTFDNDNDLYYGNCAQEEKSGWWFNSCSAVNLNGLYDGHNKGRVGNDRTADGKFDNGILWYSAGMTKWESLKTTAMMIGPGYITHASSGKQFAAAEVGDIEIGMKSKGIEDYDSLIPSAGTSLNKNIVTPPKLNNSNIKPNKNGSTSNRRLISSQERYINGKLVSRSENKEEYENGKLVSKEESEDQFEAGNEFGNLGGSFGGEKLDVKNIGYGTRNKLQNTGSSNNNGNARVTGISFGKTGSGTGNGGNDGKYMINRESSSSSSSIGSNSGSRKIYENGELISSEEYENEQPVSGSKFNGGFGNGGRTGNARITGNSISKNDGSAGSFGNNRLNGNFGNTGNDGKYIINRESSSSSSSSALNKGSNKIYKNGELISSEEYVNKQPLNSESGNNLGFGRNTGNARITGNSMIKNNGNSGNSGNSFANFDSLFGNNERNNWNTGSSFGNTASLFGKTGNGRNDGKYTINRESSSSKSISGSNSGSNKIYKNGELISSEEYENDQPLGAKLNTGFGNTGSLSRNANGVSGDTRIAGNSAIKRGGSSGNSFRNFEDNSDTRISGNSMRKTIGTGPSGSSRRSFGNSGSDFGNNRNNNNNMQINRRNSNFGSRSNSGSRKVYENGKLISSEEYENNQPSLGRSSSPRRYNNHRSNVARGPGQRRVNDGRRRQQFSNGHR